MSSVITGSRRPSSVSSAGSFTSASSTGSAGSAGCSHEEQSVVVFCDTCSQPLCDVCLTGVGHRGHRFKTLDEACKDQRDKITQQLRDLGSKINEQGNIQQWMMTQEEHLESEFARVRGHLTEQYQDLQALLCHSKEQAMRLLEAQRDSQRKPLYRLQEDRDNYKTRAEHLHGQIADLKGRMSSGSMSPELYAEILGEIQAHHISVDMFIEFYGKATPKYTLDKLRLEALEKSIQYVTEKVKEIFPRPWEFYRDITFNKDNVPQMLSLSDDQTKVTLHTGPNLTTSAVQNQAEEKPVHILAEESFKEGRHYWEVDVQDCSDWAIGVVELPQGKKLPSHMAEQHLGCDKSSWMLESVGGGLVAWHNDDLTTLKEQDVKCLGVYLDISKKSKSQLAFYDVGNGVVLHMFCLRTKKSVCPAFSLFHGADVAPSLALRKLGFHPQPPNDSDTGSVDSGVVCGLSDTESSYTSGSNPQFHNASESNAGSSPTLESIPESSPASEPIPESSPLFESTLESSPATESVQESSPTLEYTLQSSPASQSILESSPTAEPIPESSPATESVQESSDTHESIPESSPKQVWKKFKGLFKR